MGIGRFRSRVDIIEVVQGQPDGIGGYATTQSVVGTVWANVEEVDGTRVLEGNRVTNHSPYNITLRTGTYNLTTENILRYNGTDMTINSVRVDQDKRWTIVQAYADG